MVSTRGGWAKALALAVSLSLSSNALAVEIASASRLDFNIGAVAPGITAARLQPALTALPEAPLTAAAAPEISIVAAQNDAAAADNSSILSAPATASFGETVRRFAASDKSDDIGVAAGEEKFDNGRIRAADADRNLPVVYNGGPSARRSRNKRADSPRGKNSLPEKLNIALVKTVIIPGINSTYTTSVDSPVGKALIAAKNGLDQGYILMTTPRSETDVVPFHTGTVTKVVGTTIADGKVTAVLQGKREARIREQTQQGQRVEVMYRDVPLGDTQSMSKLVSEARALLENLGQEPGVASDVIEREGYRGFINLVATFTIELQKLSLDEQHNILAADTFEERLAQAVFALRDADPQADMEEAGEAGESAELAKQIETAGMPEHVKNKTLKELARMKKDKSERENIRKWLEFVVELPWTRRTPETVDLEKARAVLDAEHSGLEDVKEAILETLAVRAQTGDTKGGVMGFEGPPGVGKTTIAKAWAAATGRDLVVISLGGKSDEKYIRGIDRFYHNSSAGIIMRTLHGVSRNPVIVLDEGDQAGKDSKDGNLMATLLEILDPEQNQKFTDTYVDLPFDLSDVMFIVTGNDFSKFPDAVKDRMDIVSFGSYTLAEKTRIGQDHAVKRMLKKTGLKDVKVTDEALSALIKGYTREAGVRDMHRKLKKLFSRIVYFHRIKGEPVPATIAAADLLKYLGPPKYSTGSAVKNGVGRATGLGVSDLGGSTLGVQARLIPSGSGQLVLRAEMGESYRDSATTAWAYVRTRAADFGIDLEQLKTHDLHLSMAPSGKIDGPSAGLAMATAIVSALTGRPVRDGVAMTGAIDLYGDAWAIGGLRDKVIAAEREGYTKILYPAANQVDVPGIPADVATKVELMGMRNYDEVIEQALAPVDPAARDGFRDLGDGSVAKQEGYGFHSKITVIPKNAEASTK